MPHPGFYITMSILHQAPNKTNNPPIEQPIFTPNLSRIQLEGTAIIGWMIGLRRIMNVTMAGEYKNYSSIRVLILANV